MMTLDCKTGRPMILFITRNYPPSVGGKERLSFELINHIAKKEEVLKITWSKHLKGLWYFIIKAFIEALILCYRHENIRLIHLNDPILTPMGLLLKFFTMKPMVANVHGLDITYPNTIYQWIIPATLKKMDRIISISHATTLECERRGISPEKITIIPVGVTINNPFISAVSVPLEKLERLVGFPLKDRKIIITIGRLVKRKGVGFFVSEVLTELVKEFPDICYLVIGDGPERGNIEDIIRSNKMSSHAVLLGYVDDETLALVKEIASLFVMPNIPVEGDMEGFGIVALEAAVAGLPVVASRLEGIKEAVTDGENGILIEPGDAPGYINVLRRLLLDERYRMYLGEKGKAFAVSNFSWETIANRYYSIFEETILAQKEQEG